MFSVSVVMVLAECEKAAMQDRAVIVRHIMQVGEVVVEYTNSQIKLLILEHIHSERDRKILKRRLIDGICFEPLAEEFDMSFAQIKRIVYKGQDKIFKKL